MIEKLDWDSEFFGMKIGKFQTPEPSVALFEALLEQKKSESFDLIYLFIDTPTKDDSSDWLCLNGGILVDEKIIYQKEVSKTIFVNNTIECFSGTATQELEALAIESGHASRFKSDARLNHKFEDLFTLWIQKSATGIMADRIFTYSENEIIKGFVSIKIQANVGHIGLIAVDQNMRGKGIGRSLIARCDQWLLENNIKLHQVVTQKHNTGACALYEKCGFSLLEMQTIYHI